MRPILFTLLSSTLLMSCDDFVSPPRIVTETRLIVPPVPGDLRRPVPAPALEAKTVGDIAAVLVGFEGALTTANGRIVAIDCILRDAEAEAEPEAAAKPCPQQQEALQ